MGISNESIKSPHTSDVNFAPKVTGNYRFNNKVEFKGVRLKQECIFSS